MTKGAVNTLDEMVASYSVARITRRWPMVIFFFCSEYCCNKCSNQIAFNC
ncbi:hypothetical protein X975_04563, partial [Stegodyphus mimosarum]